VKLYDAVVVGGASVGLSTALALGQSERRVLLIEKESARAPSSSPAGDSKTFALSYASAKIYSALGIWETLADVATPIKHVHVTMQGQFGSCRLSHNDLKTEVLGYVVAAQALEDSLTHALKACPTVEVLRSASIVQAELSLNEWHMQVQVDQQTLPLSSRLLIASDGANSALRAAHYIDCDDLEYGHCGIMVNLKMKAMPEGVALERFLEKGAIALLPWQEGWATCVWTLDEHTARDLMSQNDEIFMAHCQQALGRQLGSIISIGKRYVFPLRMKLAKAQSGARFLLMGNAAHSLHPIAAQGLNLSLRDMWQLKKQVDLSSRVDMGDPEFIATYVNARKQDQNRIIFATDKIARFMASDRLSEKWRAMGITLFDSFFPLKNRFTRYSMGLG
jgi:2-octaprenyl-6-methoxyphenol hydroxylase